MRKQRRSNFTEEEKQLLTNEYMPNDIAAFIIEANTKTIENAKHRYKYSESCKAASKKNREKMKKENIENFKKTHGCYNFWTQAMVDYILNSTDTDKEQARKLGKTIYAVQKKRQRELAKQERNEANES